MLVPIGLSNPRNVTHRLESRNKRRLVGRVRHNRKDVDNRLGHEPRHTSCANVLHPKRTLTKGRFDPLRFTREVFRPCRIVLYESDRAFKGLEFTPR